MTEEGYVSTVLLPNNAPVRQVRHHALGVVEEFSSFKNPCARGPFTITLCMLVYCLLALESWQTFFHSISFDSAGTSRVSSTVLNPRMRPDHGDAVNGTC